MREKHELVSWYKADTVLIFCSGYALGAIYVYTHWACSPVDARLCNKAGF